MFLIKTKNMFSKNPKIPKIQNSQNQNFGGFFENSFFVLIKNILKKNKIFKIKLYFCKLSILNLYVSNLQLPTPNHSSSERKPPLFFKDLTQNEAKSAKNFVFADFEEGG